MADRVAEISKRLMEISEQQTKLLAQQTPENLWGILGKLVESRDEFDQLIEELWQLKAAK